MNPPPHPPTEPGPQVGDKYTDGVRSMTVTAVGEKHALAKDDANTTNEDKYPLIPVAEGGTFRPVIPPSIVFVNTVAVRVPHPRRRTGPVDEHDGRLGDRTGRPVADRPPWIEVKVNPDGTWTPVA